MILLNYWAGGIVDDIFVDFRIDPIRNIDIILASYYEGNYEGYAFVLFKQNGKLWEVNGSHCSCYGLEYQWDPEETTIESLRHRLKEGTLGNSEYSGNVFNVELEEVLNQLEKE